MLPPTQWSHEMSDFFIWEIYNGIKLLLSKNLNSKKYSHEKYTTVHKVINIVANRCRDKDGGGRPIEREDFRN